MSKIYSVAHDRAIKYIHIRPMERQCLEYNTYLPTMGQCLEHITYEAKVRFRIWVWVQVRVRVRVRVRMWMSAVCMVQVRAYALLVVDRRGKVAWDGQDKDGSAAGLQDGVSRGKECAEDAGLDACIGSNEIIARFSSKGREIVGRGCELNTVQVVKWVDPSVRTAPGSYLFASNVKTI